MPIYEYQCAACGQTHEALQGINEQALTDCPACGKPALSKLMSNTSFQLKGSGWYVTDFRDKDKPKATENTTAPKNDAEASTPSTPSDKASTSCSD